MRSRVEVNPARPDADPCHVVILESVVRHAFVGIFRHRRRHVVCVIAMRVNLRPSSVDSAVEQRAVKGPCCILCGDMLSGRQCWSHLFGLKQSVAYLPECS